MPDEIITKTPEQLAEEAAILAHCIVDPQAWIDNAIANNLEFAIQEKINKYRQEYLSAKYLSITVDPETGIETRIENPAYLNRAERDALEEEKRSPLYGKTPAEIIEIKKQQINTECQGRIYTQFPAYHQANVANGLYPDNGMKIWISAVITESNRCTDLLDAAQEAIPNWPVYTIGGV